MRPLPDLLPSRARASVPRARAMIDIERAGWTRDDVFKLFEVREFMRLTLRVSATAAGNPGRCRMEACRKTGRCHLAMTSEDIGPCHAGMTNEMLEHAALMFFFLVQFLRVHILMEPWSPYANDRRWRPDPPKRKRRKKETAIPPA